MAQIGKEIKDKSMVFRNMGLGSRGINKNRFLRRKITGDEEGWSYRMLLDVVNYMLLYGCLNPIQALPVKVI